MPEMVSRKTRTMMGINRLWVCALPCGMLQNFGDRKRLRVVAVATTSAMWIRSSGGRCKGGG
jgi:hypothetical protein